MVNFTLDKSSPVPFYRQLIDLTLAGVSTGAILPGDKLPTVREAAVNLEVNPNTIAKAYSQLRIMGVLDTQQGSGVFVSQKRPSARSDAEKTKAVQTLCRDFAARAQMLDISAEELVQCLNRMREEPRDNPKSKE